MKTGDKAILKKEISYPSKDEYGCPITEVLPKGTSGTVANVVDIPGETLIFFNPDNTESVFAVAYSSVKKAK